MRGARTACVLGILAVAIGAAALRLPRLALRPMHGDEANQAVKTATLLETGRYAYNPHDHHGPSLYYLALPVLWAAGAETAPEITDGLLRFVPAVFGVLAVLLLLLLSGRGRPRSPLMGEGRGEGDKGAKSSSIPPHPAPLPPGERERDGLGRPAAVCAGVLAAVSPALVFYSRYYVQETLLVCFTFATIATAWRYVATRKVGWAVAAGACLGLMHATKETWVLAGASMAAALVLVLLWERYAHRRVLEVRSYLRPGAVGGALVAAAAVAVVLFTSFFTHARGPLDSVLTFYYNLAKAGGESIHVQPWHWYLKMLACSRLVTDIGSGPWWSEALILGLALAGMVAAFTGRGLGRTHRGLARFLAVYTILLTAAYALIRYKTPWCCISFLHAMTLMAGVGAVALVRWVPARPAKVLVALVLAAGAVHLGWQAHRAAFRFSVDQRNPYVYAHTSPDAMKLVRRVEEVAEVSPQGREMVVKVITPTNYWPLPWYLRGFPHVGYYHQVPEDCDASVIITSPEWTEAIAKRTEGTYNQASLFGLRPGVLMSVWIPEPLWDDLVKKWSAKQQARAARPVRAAQRAAVAHPRGQGGAP